MKRILCTAALLAALHFCAPGFAADPPPAPRFAVHEYRVLGNTVLNNRQIEGVLYPLLGDGKSMDDVQAARAALESAYHSLGYGTVYVDIPQQQIVDGIVRLRVTEGRLRERSISGARYFSEGAILEQLPATQPGTVPRIPELQAQLNALNAQTPDRAVVPVFKAGPAPGTTDLALQVVDHLPLHGSIDFNNQYTADTRPLRLNVDLSYDDLFAALDSISAQFSTSPQDTAQVQVLNVAYAFHPLAFGLRPSLSFTNSASDVTSIGTLGVLGDGQIYSGRLVFPAVVQPGSIQNLTLGIDYKHFRNTINLAATTNPDAMVSDIEPIAYANVSLAYGGFWSWPRADGKVAQSVGFDLTANAGPRGVTNETLNFDNTRYQGRGNYGYLRGDLAYTLTLPKEAQLILKVAGQAAEDPLVVYEQDALTGADAVRGYLEAEVLTDDGVRETVQFQSPPLRHKTRVLADGFVFFDDGHAHYLAPLPGQPSSTDLRSVGAGFDILPGYPHLNGTFTWAYPLLPGPDTKAHDSRFLFDLKGSF